MWTLHRDEDGVFEGTIVPRVRNFMTDEDGTRIERTGTVLKENRTIFLLSYRDLKIKFFARRCSKDRVPDDMSLGPVCVIDILKRDISRSLTSGEGHRVARVIDDFMSQYGRFPEAVAPFPESVVLTEATRLALNLPR